MDMQFLPFCKEHVIVVPNHYMHKTFKLNSIMKYKFKKIWSIDIE